MVYDFDEVSKKNHTMQLHILELMEMGGEDPKSTVFAADAGRRSSS